MRLPPRLLNTLTALGALLLFPLPAAAQDGLARQVLSELNLAQAYADHLRESGSDIPRDTAR